MTQGSLDQLFSDTQDHFRKLFKEELIFGK